MDWLGPDSKWREQILERRRHQRRQMLVVLVGGSALVGAFYLWWLAQALPVPGFELIGGGVAVALLGGMLVIVGATEWSLRRERRLLERVAACDGLVCPRCRRPAERSEDDAYCKRCKRSYSADKLRMFWIEFPRTGVWDYYARFPEEGKRSAGMSAGWRAGGGTVLAVCLILVAMRVFVHPSAPLSFFLWDTLTSVLPYALFGIAGTLVARALVRRGSEPRCAECGYQKPPEGPVSERCPECAADWNAVGGTVYGRRAAGGRSIAWAAALAVLALAAAAPHWTAAPSRWLPTGLLINDAVYGTLNDRAWSEINQRRLTAEQRNELARKLLDRRLERGRLGHEGSAWLWKQVAGGKLPSELAERFYDEFFEARLVTPERVPAGRPFTARMEVHARYTPLPPIVKEAALIEGLYVGPAAEPIGRRDRFDYLGLLDEPEYAFSAVVPPQPPGQVELRMVFWFVVNNGITARIAGWEDDGQPWFAPTVVYRRRYELKASVLVEDGMAKGATNTERTGDRGTRPATR